MSWLWSWLHRIFFQGPAVSVGGPEHMYSILSNKFKFYTVKLLCWWLSLFLFFLLFSFPHQPSFLTRLLFSYYTFPFLLYFLFYLLSFLISPLLLFCPLPLSPFFYNLSYLIPVLFLPTSSFLLLLSFLRFLALLFLPKWKWKKRQKLIFCPNHYK